MEYVCRTLSTTELFRLPNSDLGLESDTFLNIMYEDFLELILTSLWMVRVRTFTEEIISIKVFYLSSSEQTAEIGL